MVLPVVTPPIDDGAVLVGGNQILRVGPWNDLRLDGTGQVWDLGESILLPGLINAHCHLDYTDMVGQIPPPKSFSDWIKALLALKAHRTYSDYASSWLSGAQMLLRHGTTTVADIEAVPELLPDVLTTTPMRVWSLIEVTGVRSRRPAEEILQRAAQTIASIASAEGHRAGLSPHAPYSTTGELLRLSAETARKQQWIMATHVAESVEESEMYLAGKGPMFDWLQGQRDMSDCACGSPVQHLHRNGVLGPNLLAIHANYVSEDDANLLGHHGTHVVHCPRSHAYFRHAPFPRATLTAAGVNICLGTDSLASVRRQPRVKPELNMFAEMRTLADRDDGIDAAGIVRLATVNAARALGATGQLGELSAGALADLIAIPFSGRTSLAYEAILRHRTETRGVMIDGRWAIAPGSV